MIFLADEFLFFFLELEDSQKDDTDLNESNAHRRIKDSQIFVLNRRFRNIMAEHHKETLAHRERCKKAIIRELDIGKFVENKNAFLVDCFFVAGQEMSKDELEKLLDNDCSSSLNFRVRFSCRLNNIEHLSNI